MFIEEVLCYNFIISIDNFKLGQVSTKYIFIPKTALGLFWWVQANDWNVTRLDVSEARQQVAGYIVEAVLETDVLTQLKVVSPAYDSDAAHLVHVVTPASLTGAFDSVGRGFELHKSWTY